jgi:hypothetical protein
LGNLPDNRGEEVVEEVEAEEVEEVEKVKEVEMVKEETVVLDSPS